MERVVNIFLVSGSREFIMTIIIIIIGLPTTTTDRLIFDNVKTWAGTEWLSRSLIITAEVTGGGAERRCLFTRLV